MACDDDGVLFSTSAALGLDAGGWGPLVSALDTDDWAEALRQIRRLRDALMQAEGRAVAVARAEGASWGQIGTAVGIARQVAHARWSGSRGAG